MDTTQHKKTIALVANSTWNIYNFRQNLIDKFLQEGLDVVIIAPVDEYITYKEKYPSIRHFNIRLLDRDGTNPIKDSLLVLELFRRYKKIKPDIVLHFTNKPNIYGGVAAKMAGVTSYATVTGLGYAFIHKGLVRTMMTWLYQLTARCHKRFIFENIEDRELFRELGIVSGERAVSIKGCGVNTKWFHPYPEKTHAEKTIFTFIGRLLYDKGIKEFVDAARLVKSERKDVEFWIVGELDPENPATVDKEDLISWVQEDIVLYHGFIKDVRPVIAQSDCIVLPSYREGLPRTIIEAMSMEKPVITTNTAGCNETVEESINGYLIPIRSAQALKIAFDTFLKLSPSERNSMGMAGRIKAVKEFDDKIISENIFRILSVED